MGSFFPGTSYAFVLTAMGWATFRAFFSQTHLVTLLTKSGSNIFRLPSFDFGFKCFEVP
jgi:hypothetical protein